MKKLITILLTLSWFLASAQTPVNPTPRTPVAGFSPKVIQDRDLRAIKSMWIPITMSTTPAISSIDSAGSNLQLLSNGNLSVSKGLGTGFWQYLTTAGGAFTGSVTAPTFIGALTGNATTASSATTATTATTLANTRTIWGQNFNGSANVSGALTGVTAITATGNYSATSSSSNSVSSTSSGTTTNASVNAINDAGSVLQLVSYGSAAVGNDLGTTRAGNSMVLYAGAGNIAIGSRSTNDIIFSTNNTERARISGSTGKFTVSVAPTNATDVVRKTELDLKVGLSGNETVNGTKTFTGLVANSPTILTPIETRSISSITSNFTITTGNYYTILADATSGDITATLPTASSASGRIYVIKKIDGSVNTVILDADGSELIDGSTTKVMAVQWASLMIQSNGSAWYILSKN